MIPAVSLPAKRVDDVIEVLADAFHDYPVMRFVVGADGDIAARVRRLVTLFVTRRMRRGGPMLGVTDAGRLVGAAVLTLPVEPDAPPEINRLAEAAWRDLGDAARDRYQAYADVATTLFADMGPHHHLNMIGVRQSHSGRGLARPLMDAVARMAEQDVHSAGLSLTTERARNLTLYEHFGYRVVAHRDIAPGFETWGLVREIASPKRGR